MRLQRPACVEESSTVARMAERAPTAARQTRAEQPEPPAAGTSRLQLRLAGPDTQPNWVHGPASPGIAGKPNLAAHLARVDGLQARNGDGGDRTIHRIHRRGAKPCIYSGCNLRTAIARRFGELVQAKNKCKISFAPTQMQRTWRLLQQLPLLHHQLGPAQQAQHRWLRVGGWGSGNKPAGMGLNEAD